MLSTLQLLGGMHSQQGFTAETAWMEFTFPQRTFTYVYCVIF